jgi:very-short-patch-repair endonuclease
MSLPEVLLWQQLRKRPSGLKFRRQQAAGRYVGDFYCCQANLLIEIDGEAHNRGNAPEFDARRNVELAAQGIRILRVPAIDVLENMEGVVMLIVRTASSACTPPPSCGWFPSPEGEDF